MSNNAPIEQPPPPPIVQPAHEIADRSAPPPAVDPAPAAPAPPHLPPDDSGPNPAVHFAPRGRLPRPSDSKSNPPGLSTMLEMTSGIAWYDNEDLSVNTFVPSFHALSLAVVECDNLMASTHRFVRSHQHWCVYVSQLYFSVLFYFRIFDCMELAGVATPAVRTTLQWIKNAFDPRRIRIPGPLVPYFQSLSVCASNSTLLGDVCPVVPQGLTASRDNFYSLDDYRYALPNVPALMDCLIEYTYIDWADDPDQVNDEHTSLFRSPVTDANHDAIAQALVGPGISTVQEQSASEYRTFRRASYRLHLPPRAQVFNSTRTVAWTQFLCFAPFPGVANHRNFTSWFPQVVALMADYADYFHGSISLADIPVASGPSPHVLLSYLEGDDNIPPGTEPEYFPAVVGPPAVDAYLTVRKVNTLAANSATITPGLLPAHLQLATVAQTNAIVRGIDFRVGDFWTSSRQQQKCAYFNTMHNLPAHVATFHVETALRR
jgi:hypothetical protein